MDAMKQQLRKELNDLVGKKREPIEQLREKIKSLTERVRQKNSGDPHSIISFEYPSIQELRDKIIQ